MVLYKRYDKPFHPEIFGGITDLLFEPMDKIVSGLLKTTITDVINNYEPRINLNRVSVHVSPDQHGFYVTLYYFIERVPAEQVTELFLERVR